ncbi:MAG TPA: fumarylacetoacetate hydrolase family protein [Baekduia sp.]|nr:fumarylacetoacetate hydrolase family protein [Baekduia sp.]
MSAERDADVVTDRGRLIYGATPPGQAVPCRRDTPLTEDELDLVVETIAAGRIERRAANLPEELRTRHWPSVIDVLLRLDERLGRPPAGWKIGAASEEVRISEGLPAPCPGRVYADGVFSSPATLPASLFINYRNVECELAFRLGDAIQLRDRPYSAEEIAGRIQCLTPTLEIGDMVFEDWYGASAYFGSCLDNGGGAAVVHGEDIVDWQDLDLPNARLALFLNDSFVKEGFGRQAMGHPLTALTWLVNWLQERGRGLAAGELVSTGTCTGHCFVAEGDEVALRVDGIGLVTAVFAGSEGDGQQAASVAA